MTKKVNFSCTYTFFSLPLQRETQRRDVCTSAEGFADILKRRLLRFVLMISKLRNFQNVHSGLSNDRCPTGYRLSLSCLFGTLFAHIRVRMHVP